MNKSLLKALKVLGTHAALAQACGVTRQQIGKWLKRKIPAHHVISIEKATGGKITRYEMRPDIYPKE